MLAGRARRRVQAEELLVHGVAANRPQYFSLNLLRPAKVFLWCACFAECVLIVPNVAAELHMADDGPHVAICRICLFVARMSLLVAPAVARVSARCGLFARERMSTWLLLICGTACGSVEPSRGIATALAGWYLISTPMHDAFGTQSEGGGKDDEGGVLASTGLLVPCAMIMAANVCLFLCDALMLTVAPLLRQQSDAAAAGPQVPRQWSTPEVFRFGMETAKAMKDQDFEATCVICLSDFEHGETVARLPCRHVFHADCVGEWLGTHGTCPMRCHGYVLPPRPIRPLEGQLGATRGAWLQTGSLEDGRSLEDPGSSGGASVASSAARAPLPPPPPGRRTSEPGGGSAAASALLLRRHHELRGGGVPGPAAGAGGERPRVSEQDTLSLDSLATEELMQEAAASVVFPLPSAVQSPVAYDAPTTIGVPESEVDEIGFDAVRRSLSREVWS